MAQNVEAQRRAKVECAIAQIKLKQSLKKADQEALLPPVALEDSAQFCANLDAVLQRNTPTNVQKCTQWIVKHITPSKARTAVLGGYLVSVSKSIVVDQEAAATATKAKATARNRFHLLLIVNDVLHTDKFHRRGSAKQGTFSKAANSSTSELISLTASVATEKDLLIEKKLRALLNYWAINQLVNAEDLKSLRDRADEALMLAQGGAPIRKRNYLLPEYHGDRAAPWYELPASYMLDQMIRYPERPIDPSRIRIAKLDKKPVSPHVRKLLDNYFENIDLIYQPTGENPTGETKSNKLSLDSMGHVVKKNKETGESAMVYNGYGWSTKFCQDMQTHGVPENIKIAREDVRRMDDDEEARDLRPRRRDERRLSRSPRRGRQSSSESEYRRERGRHDRSRSYSRGRRQSGSSYDSRGSRSRSRNRSYNRQHRPSRDDKRGSNDRGRGYDDRGSRQARSPPKLYGRDFNHPSSHWNGSNGGNPSGAQHHSPSQPPHSGGRGFSQGSQPPFSAPPYPPQPLGQFPGPLPPGQFAPPPPPPPGGFPAGMMPPFPPPPPPPPLPPPNFTGQYPPSAPNSNAMPNNSYNYGNQYNNHQGQNFGYGHNTGYGQNPGGPPGARGGYGGRYPGNRGSYGGYQRGQRGGRY